MCVSVNRWPPKTGPLFKAPLPPVKHGFTFTQKPVQTSSPLCSMSAGSSSTSHTHTHTYVHICIQPCTHTQCHGKQYINSQPSQYQSMWVKYQVHSEHILQSNWSEWQKGISWRASLPWDCSEGPSGLHVTTFTSFTAERSYLPQQLRAQKIRDRTETSTQWQC